MIDRILEWLSLETVAVTLVPGVILYFIYRAVPTYLTATRIHLLRNLLRDWFFALLAFVLFWGAFHTIASLSLPYQRVVVAVGSIAVILGAVTFIRSTKVAVFLYLFLTSRRVGVPVLLVNLVTLIISLFIGAWILTHVFEVRLAPLLATSAFLSVVLGLALQDTLGNLFAGISIQIDKPYEIGDWIEVHSGGTVFIGEVQEISWRATVLWGVDDEVIILPNKMIAQNEVSNFSARHRAIYRGLSIWVDPSSQPEMVRTIFDRILGQVKGIRKDIQRWVMFRDLNHQGAHWRLFFPIHHYAERHFVTDEILSLVLPELKRAGVSVARFRVDADTQSRGDQPQNAG